MTDTDTQAARPAAGADLTDAELDAFGACWRAASERYPNSMDVAVAMWDGGKAFARATAPRADGDADGGAS